MSDKPKTFATFISMARELKGLTQEEVAKKFGINRATLSEWESGNSEPLFSKAINCMCAMGFTLADFCRFIGFKSRDL